MAETRTVLLVDDEPINLDVLGGLLSGPYRVKVATSGPRALEICAAEPPDLVLLDVMMPEMDGYEVCRRLKADPKLQEIPVIFVSALQDEGDEARGFGAGAIDYITKPIKPAIALQRVRSHLELAEARKRLERLGRQYSSYLSPELARGISVGEISASVGSKRKKLVVFFSDIQGFTEQSEKLEPEDLGLLLNSYFEAMNGIIARHGGTLDKYIGDAILVFFGDPHTRGLEADAEACVNMALDMQEAITVLAQDWRKQGILEPLRVRMGITMGFCTVGNFGSSHKIDYTIIGSPVNLAARVQALADPGSVLICEEVWQLLGDKFDCVPHPPQQVKGVSLPVSTWEVRQRARGPCFHLALENAVVSVKPALLSDAQKAAVRQLLAELLGAL